MVPEDVHVPVPGTCGCVALQGKRDCADIVKVKDLEMGSCIMQEGPVESQGPP